MMDVMLISPKMYDIQYKMIDGSLESLQELVGGYIEICTPPELKAWRIELLANEEGLIKGLEVNKNFEPFFLVGNVVAVGVAYDEFVSLSGTQMRLILEWLDKLERSNLNL